MFDKDDYVEFLNRARKKRNQNPYTMYIVFGVGVILALSLIIGGVVLMIRQLSGSEEAAESKQISEMQESTLDPVAESRAAEESSREEEESKQAQELADRQAVVDSYGNLGFIQVSGYLNVRRSPDPSGDIIGKMQENTACEILGQEGDWYHISSGGVDGYISGQYVITGEEARQKALEQVKPRAIVTADNLNIRSAPEMDPTNIVAQALVGERYEVLEEVGEWIHIPSGYISSNYAEVKLALNEARKMDLKAMAINQYNNIVISKVQSYLNIRSSPKDEGNSNIIGKLPGKAAGEILEAENGWYKIRSGNITGYVTADPQFTATGQEAVD